MFFLHRLTVLSSGVENLEVKLTGNRTELKVGSAVWGKTKFTPHSFRMCILLLLICLQGSSGSPRTHSVDQASLEHLRDSCTSASQVLRVKAFANQHSGPQISNTLCSSTCKLRHTSAVADKKSWSFLVDWDMMNYKIGSQFRNIKDKTVLKIWLKYLHLCTLGLMALGLSYVAELFLFIYFISLKVQIYFLVYLFVCLCI